MVEKKKLPQERGKPAHTHNAVYSSSSTSNMRVRVGLLLCRRRSPEECGTYGNPKKQQVKGKV